ncbi:histidine ammonia-lyase [Photobacterium proteolyticum]|uniref:Histidine ammonia-lyase n=1 Tax=Photobacterium proteolyticum TaxID=1903952 RepID=A0A1Q9H158_9GAMM|nr:histidine ammonia-lyase [Photobacterium proteolyticum]OLQ81162.1 histidine ammonia-lyase [Photobacterium proteolyticum]
MMYKNARKLSYLAVSLAVIFTAGCNSDSGGNSGATPTPTPTSSTKVDVFSNISNCSSASDVPNCGFKNGIYVLNIGPNVSSAQQERVITQVNNLLKWAHDDVRKQFAQKRVVIGVIEKEPETNEAHNQFVLKLAENMYSNAQVLDAIELIYTNIGGKDETTSTTAYQKLLQVFDYYVDGDNQAQVGAELTQSYSGFKVLINNKMGTGSQADGYLKYDECNYGNGQLDSNRIDGTPNPCTEGGSTTNDDGEDISKGKKDPIHTKPINLNPGALLGSLYEYKVAPANKKYPGELKDVNGDQFTGIGKVASGDTASANYPFNWSNRGFAPLNDYLNKWFFTNNTQVQNH